MKTKQQIIEGILNRFHLVGDHIEVILEEELPDFQRIDEERMGKILNNIVGSSIYYDQLLQKSVTLEAVRIYNSTLSKAPAQPPALKPLPKDFPIGFRDIMNNFLNMEKAVFIQEVWNWLQSKYGTPSKEPLPSVEELTGEVVAIYGATHTNSIHDTLVRIAQNIHSKYSLHPKQPLPSYHDLFKELYQISVKSQSTILISTLTKHLISKYSLHPKQEWWMKLKEGDKFKWEKEVQKFKKFRTYLVDEDGITYLATTCTPYTTPSAQDIISKYGLSEEEVRAIREGKCT